MVRCTVLVPSRLTVWIAALSLAGVGACDPPGPTCEEHRCDEGFAGELVHQSYSRCVECDAATDVCTSTLVGEDGEEVQQCTSCLGCEAACPMSIADATAIYCTGSI